MAGGRRPRAAILAIASLALTGCGAATGGAGAPAGASQVVGRSPARPVTATVDRAGRVCLDRPGAVADPNGEQLPPGPDRARLGDHDPARFALCSTTDVRVQGDGEWETRIERGSVSAADVHTLASALRLPDQPSPAGQSSCAASLEIAPELWAVDSGGHAVLVRWPVDGCGFIRHDVRGVFDAVRWEPVAQRRLRRTASQGALDSGCETAYKQMVWITAQDRPTTAPGSLAGMADAPSGRVCVYRVDDRSQVPTGSFVRGRRLKDDAWRSLLTALAAAPGSPASCTRLGDLFAVVTPPMGDPAYVELDGCRRVLTPDGGFRQATPALLRLLPS